MLDPSDPSSLIGRSAEEVGNLLGEPATRSGDVGRYAHPLGFGAHHEQHFTVVQFRDDRVVAVRQETKPIGCVIIPFPDDLGTAHT